MCELSVLIGEYMAFRAARGFQPNHRTERLLAQFVGSLPSERQQSLLFSQADALAWAHAPAGWLGCGSLLAVSWFWPTWAPSPVASDSRPVPMPGLLPVAAVRSC
jgi:hypothetical protein